jgi:hypothetical protein
MNDGLGGASLGFATGCSGEDVLDFDVGEAEVAAGEALLEQHHPKNNR